MNSEAPATDLVVATPLDRAVWTLPRLLGMSIAGVIIGLVFGATLRHALEAYAVAALGFGGLMLLFILAAALVSQLKIRLGKGEEPALLPAGARIVRPVWLAWRWRPADALLVVMLVSFASSGRPTFAAFLGGYGLGAGVDMVLLSLVGAARDRASGRRSYVTLPPERPRHYRDPDASQRAAAPA
jgi:hypothetical protein